MTQGGFQTGLTPTYSEPIPKPPLRVKLTPRERGSYNILLSQADPDGHNRVEGAQAVEFFKRSGLPTEVLKNIWVICTPEGEGYLDRERFYVALRLISLAQEGKPVSEQAIFDDIAAGIPKFQSNVVVKDKWEVEAADKEKYTKAFAQISSGKGFLTTEEALEVFRKTQVRPEYLKKIWNLSDPTDSGEFRENQFIVAMHLVTRVKSQSEPVPDELPAALKKIITVVPAERKSLTQSEPFGDFGGMGMSIPKPQNPGDAFADFGIPPIVKRTTEAFPTGISTDFGLGGLGLSANFQTMPIKNNLEEPRVGATMGSMNNMASMNSMNSISMKANATVSKTEEKREDDMIGFESPIQKKNSGLESPKNEILIKQVTRKSVEPKADLSSRDQEIHEQLEKIEEKIQKKLRELKDVRAKLSVEREKNQMLSSKLSDSKSKQLNELAQSIINILEG